MRNFTSRAVQTFFFLSISSLASELTMRAQGINSRFNPAWLFVHTIFKFFAMIWLFISALLVILVLINALMSFIHARCVKIRSKIEEAKSLETENRMEVAPKHAAAVAAKMEEVRKNEAERALIERVRIAQEQREIRARRSPADAINTAFEEFLKGDW